MGSQTSTTQNYAGAQSPQAGQAMSALSQTLPQLAGQTGDLSQLAAGQVQLQPWMREFVQQIQSLTSQQAQSGMTDSMQAILRQLEDSNIARGIDTSSLAAVNQGLIGQDFLRQMGQIQMGGQRTAAEQMMNMPFQAANTQLNANQLLLNTLVQGAQPMLNYDAMMRQLTGSSSQRAPFNWGGMVGQIGGNAAQGYTQRVGT